MKDNKKPITIYYSAATNSNAEIDWSFLYQKPKTLYRELLEYKDKNAGKESMFACPAINKKYKNILVFKNSMNCSYDFDMTKENNQSPYIVNTTDNFINAKQVRNQALTVGPSIDFSLNYFLFADEPLMASFTAPFFHKAEYMNYGAIIPGEFDIGQWFRTFNMEIQMWNNKGEFHLKEDEPLFYVELKTERPIILKSFVMNEYLENIAKTSTATRLLFGAGESLNKRYQRFKNVGLRDKILTEIKKNIIDEN
jgi:hypothetical protein